MGIVGEGPVWRCPPETWAWFYPADYFLRGFHRDTGEFLGAWHFRKQGVARVAPLELHEIDAAMASRGA